MQVSLSSCFCKHAEVGLRWIDFQACCDLFPRTIYEKLASAFTEEIAILYRQRVEEISPNIRYCAYNIGELMLRIPKHVPLTHRHRKEPLVRTLVLMSAVL